MGRVVGLAVRGVARWWVPVSILVAWQCWIWIRDVPAIIAPTPLQVAGELARPGWLLGPLASTVWLTVVGVVLGLAAGVFLAVVCWWIAPARAAVIPPALLAQTVPLVVFIPVLGRIVGFGTPSVVAISVLVGLFPSLVFVDAGLSSVPTARHEVAQVFGASRYRYLLHIALPTTVPRLAVAIRLTASFAFLGSVTAEFMVGAGGLGRLLSTTQFLVRTSRSWAISCVVIAASVALYSAAGAFERWAHDRFDVTTA